MTLDKIELCVVGLVATGIMVLVFAIGLNVGRAEANDTTCSKVCANSGWKNGEFDKETLCRCWTNSTQEGHVPILPASADP